MKSKVVIGAVVGSILCFFLGWVVYGMLLMDVYNSGMNQCMAKPMEDFSWPAMIGFNIAFGTLLAVVLNWANVKGFADGFVKGAIFGFLLTLGYDLNFLAMTDMFTNNTMIFIDLAVATVFEGLIAGLIAMAMQRFG